MDWMDVEFTTDLVNSAYLHLCFLDRVDNFEKVLKGKALQHALKRYEQLWLPLAYENRSVEMVAPVDVHWLWYIHMLQPLAYRRDCRKMLKTTLDHRFMAESRIITGTNNAIEVWYATYPKEGYNIIRNDEYVRPRRNKGQIDQDKPSKLSADLVSLAETHMHFCYQVALPHFRDKKYLENAEKRYKQFLCLKRLEPEEFLTPSVDILLMWYTHMCNPVAYANDLMRISGKIFDNNVKVKPALINDRFIIAREKTNELWKKVSAEELVQPGTKLRSSESRKEIMQMTEEDLTDCCVVVYRIYLAHADLQNVPLTRKNQSLNLKIYRLRRDGSLWEEILFLHGDKQMWTFSTSFIFNTVEHKELKVLLSRTVKMWCVRDEKALAYGKINVRSEVNKIKPMERSVTLNIDMQADDSTDVIKLALDGAVDNPMHLLCDLTLQKSDFAMQKLSTKQLRRVWGHEGFPESFHKDEHTCYSAIHILINHENEESFRCRIMHIPELLHSDVEVFFKQKLVATSQLIGSSQLPHPSQVELRDITMAFDPELGERAMLIRNYEGDWGLCIARWSQDDGGLEVRFMKLAGKNKVQRVEIKSADVEFHSFNANLYSGKLMVNPSKNTVAENLATYWSICVLYVLCSPGNNDRQLLLIPAAETTSEEKHDDEEERQPVYVEEKNCQFLIAAGLTTETPSNQYMRAKYGSLTYDLLIDAQDIIVEEHKTSRRLLKKESVISVTQEEENSPKRKRKKRHSKLKENAENTERKTRVFVEPIAEIKSNSNKENVETIQTLKPSEIKTEEKVNSDAESKKKVLFVKPKKLKSRKSSKLEDMLVMSDDSITKDEVMETKLIKDEKGKKIVIRKISSHLDEEIAPSDDSLDEEIKEKKEFLKSLNVDKRDSDVTVSGDETRLVRGNGMIENTGLNVQQGGESLIREETTLIKEIVEKRKREASEMDNKDKDNTTDSGLDNKEHNTVTFDLCGAEVKPSLLLNTETTESVQDDTRSDTSSTKRETRQLRKQRIAKDRENKFPLSDEDPQENSDTQRRRKRKKSKQRLDIQETTLEV
ncbi:uncharacterized protein LOC123529117 isoform X2 [Mercenaria mercenaria]|uniref:uncharacterized protein LOC123529117 isoform X2 n=1 Tax=Mercenaria mercenaria TaxID=6596 RepID=UPI00234F1161|nr:uncharacterized protein LOC123529117 isoform X2 [Mercenaria mercenaria]